MAQNPSTAAGRIFGFKSDALQRDNLFVTRIEGVESISDLFRYELRLLSPELNLDVQKILDTPVRLRFKADVGARVVSSVDVCGMVSTFEFQSIFGQGKGAVYHAVVVPRLWKLTKNFQSRIFLDLTVPQIVRQVLVDAGFTDEDFEFPEAMLKPDAYPVRPKTVQHQETDFNFISRLMEHEGIFYVFDHFQDRDRVLFRDSQTDLPAIQGWSTLSYQEAKVGAAQQFAGVPVFTVAIGDEEHVHSFGFSQTHVPKEIKLQEYDPLHPTVPMGVDQEVAGTGVGTVYLYGENYRTPEEGKTLARVRSEELRAAATIYTGVSNCKGVRAGGTFQLSGHPMARLNAKYLLKHVRHVGQQDVSLLGRGGAGSYGNSFRAVPADAPFRPARITPKPRVHGSHSARIDAAGDGKYAELSEAGEYKIKTHYDLSNREPGKSSPFVRMAQAHEGLHLPLHKGTEVVIGYHCGDPDRPFIQGAMPNPDKPSPVKAPNQTQSILKTAGGNAVVLEDLQDAERLFLRAQKNLEVRVLAGAFEWTGADRHITVDRDRIEHVKNDVHEKIGRDHLVEVGGNRGLTVRGNDVVDVTGTSSVTRQGDVAQVHLANFSAQTTGDHFVKAKQIILEADAGITIKVGGSNVVIDASGVNVVGAKVGINSGSSPGAGVACAQEKPQLPIEPAMPGEIEVGAQTMTTQGASAGGDGRGVKLSWFAFQLKDKKGKPVPREPYRLKLPDGCVTGGRTDAEGKVRHDGIAPGTCEVMFPRVDDGKWRKC